VSSFSPSVNKFRFYNDGTESGSTPIANEDTNITLTVDQTDVKFHLRYRIQETGGKSGATTDDWNIQYSVGGGAYANVTTSTAKIQVDTGSSLTDAAATTNRGTNGITDGTGTFVASQQEEGDGQITDFQLTASNFTEAVWAMKAISADVADTMSITFRVSLNGGSPGVTNSVTPTITIGKTTFAKDGRLAAAGVGR
jgi:hypothetical protein